MTTRVSHYFVGIVLLALLNVYWFNYGSAEQICILALFFALYQQVQIEEWVDLLSLGTEKAPDSSDMHILVARLSKRSFVSRNTDYPHLHF